MTPFQSQYFRGPRHIPVRLVQLLQNVIPLVSVPRLMQSRELGLGRTPPAVAINQRRKMLRIKPRRRRYVAKRRLIETPAEWSATELRRTHE